MKYVNGISILLLLVIGLVIAGCSSGDKSEVIPSYEGWEKYSYKHFVYHYPPNSFWGRNMDRFSAAYEKYLAEDCDFLGIAIPKDTIHFFIHNSVEEGTKLTGRQVPFHTKRTIHWGRVSPFGLELAKYLINNYWGVRKTDFDFLYLGLATLRDYAGLDYHHQTAALVEMKKFIPLDSLADNDIFNRLRVRPDENAPVDPNYDPLTPSFVEWESASFVAFITYNFGINRLKMLWQSTSSFDKSIRELFDMDVKTFEDKWLEFAMLYFEGIQRGDELLDSTIQVK